MTPVNLIMDSYERKARLYPALLLIAPVVSVVVSTLSATLSALQSLIVAIVGCGGAFLFAQLARDSGLKKEKELFKKWGGMPSVVIFRHSDTRIDAITKRRYHEKLATLVKGANAPTAEQEQSDPAAADAVYLAWSNYLRTHTHDKEEFNLLFQENVSYGYRRNVWGLRPIGLVVSLMSFVACGALLFFRYQSSGKLDEALIGAGALSAILLLLWIFCFTSSWVRVPADAYAERLAECTEALEGKVATSK